MFIAICNDSLVQTEAVLQAAWGRSGERGMLGEAMAHMRLTYVVALGLTLVGGLTLPNPVAAEPYADVAKLLRVESDSAIDALGPPRLTGHIYNDSAYRIGSVRLRIETVDASNQVVKESLAWVYATLPARGRAYFSVRRPSSGELFRLTVESFVLIAREAVDETP